MVATANPQTLRERFDRMQRACFAVGAVGVVALGFGFALEREQFFRSWLVAFLFWIAVPLGSLALVMLHHMTGGSWGFAIRRLLEASMRTLPLFALFFVPIALGVHELYEWSHADVVASDPVLAHKAAYLNVPFFLARAALYFALWIALSVRLNQLSARYDRVGGSGPVRRMRALAGPGIALYGVTMTFAALDWAMSLEPHWFSTIYGMIFIVGQALSTLAFAIVASAWLSRREPFARWMSKEHFHDLGKMLFAFVMLWAYLAYSQYLIVWAGNIAEETPWYLRRTLGGWRAVVLTLIALHFALPFLLLLSRELKRNPARLAVVATALFALRFVDLFWLVTPAFHPEGFHVSWLDLVAPVAMGAIWFGIFLGQLKGRPLISLQDARLEGALESPAHG